MILRSAFRAQKKKLADGNDNDGLDNDECAVGKKEGDQNTKPKGKNGDSDQLPECDDFHKLPPFAFYIIYMQWGGKYE